MASELGLTQQNVTGSVLVSLSSTTQVTPNYWVNPENRVNYVLAVQTPPDRIASVDALMSTPIINGQNQRRRRRILGIGQDDEHGGPRRRRSS